MGDINSMTLPYFTSDFAMHGKIRSKIRQSHRVLGILVTRDNNNCKLQLNLHAP